MYFILINKFTQFLLRASVALERVFQLVVSHIYVHVFIRRRRFSKNILSFRYFLIVVVISVSFRC